MASGKESEQHLLVGNVIHDGDVIRVTDVRPPTFVDKIRDRLPDYLEALKVGLRSAYDSPFPIPLKSLVKHHRLIAVGCFVTSGVSYGVGTYLNNQNLQNLSLFYLGGGIDIMAISLGVRFLSSKLRREN